MARTANAIAKISRRFWREVNAQGDETVRLVAIIKESVLTSASVGSNEVLIPLQGKRKRDFTKLLDSSNQSAIRLS